MSRTPLDQQEISKGGLFQVKLFVRHEPDYMSECNYIYVATTR